MKIWYGMVWYMYVWFLSRLQSSVYEHYSLEAYTFLHAPKRIRITVQTKPFSAAHHSKCFVIERPRLIEVNTVTGSNDFIFMKV
uniref:Putative secreted protein n=1 Tax=Anopheles triannulatus TaxID=58253 RepID=A0A2M4B443_9DIPT